MKAWNSTLSTKREKPRRIAQDTQKGVGASILHQGPFRSPDLLSLAAKAPKCFHCGAKNVGQVVGCHPNGLHYGKGTGQKGHDIPAFFCGECHDLMDGRTGTLTRFERDLMYLRGSNDSLAWALQSGYLQVITEAA